MDKVTKILSKVTLYLFLSFIFVIFLLPICPIPLQNDTFYDIILGERYLKQGMFNVDDYSIHEGLIYQTHHYSVCIINYLVYDLNPSRGLYILELGLAGIMALQFYLNNREYFKSKFISYAVMYIQMVAMMPFISVRAQMYSYIVFLIELLALQRYFKNRKKIYLFILTILPLILINFHSGTIIFYFIIMGTYLVAYLFKLRYYLYKLPSLISNLINKVKIKTKKVGVKVENAVDIEVAADTIEADDGQKEQETIQLAKRNELSEAKRVLITFAIIVFIGVLLTLINPYGLKGLTYGLKTVNNEWINKNISEFQPFNIKSPNGYFTLTYLLILIVCFIYNKKRLKAHEFLLVFGTFLMNLMSIRHNSLFIIVSLVAFRNIQDIFDDFRQRTNLSESFYKYSRIIMYSLFVILAVRFHLDRVNDTTRGGEPIPGNIYPVKAVEYIKENVKPDENIFNEYGWGSYLMFKQVKVFIDSRCDLYTKEYNEGVEVAEDYMKTMNLSVDANKTMDKYNVKYVLIYKDSSLAKILNEKEAFTRVYSDDFSAVFKYEKPAGEIEENK